MPRKQQMADRLGVSRSESSRQFLQIRENLAKERRGTTSKWHYLGSSDQSNSLIDKQIAMIEALRA